jgi:hypothetical protein
MEMIHRDIFPGWALFTYTELKTRAGDALAPELLCLECKDALLLAPSIEKNTVSGMLIASESASNTIRIMRSPCGLEVEVKLPRINNKYEAQEDVELNILKITEKHQV